MKKVDYKILIAKTHKELENKVVNYMKNGYRPVGSVNTCPGVLQTNYMQAVEIIIEVIS